MKDCNCCERQFNNLNNFESHLESYDHFLNETKAKFKQLRYYTLKLYSETL
jgi:hypothetical protein